MDGWIVLAIVVALVVLGWVAQRKGWVDLSDKRKKRGGGGASIAGIADEVFAPRKHEAQAEMERQALIPAPAPIAGDGDKGIALSENTDDVLASDRFGGSIRLDVDPR